MSRAYFSLSVEQGILTVVPDWTSSDVLGFVNCKLNCTCKEGKHVTELVRTETVLYGDRWLNFFSDEYRPQKFNLYNTSTFYWEDLI